MDLVRIILQFVEKDPELQKDRQTFRILNTNRELPGLQIIARHEPTRHA